LDANPVNKEETSLEDLFSDDTIPEATESKEEIHERAADLDPEVVTSTTETPIVENADFSLNLDATLPEVSSPMQETTQETINEPVPESSGTFFKPTEEVIEPPVLVPESAPYQADAQAFEQTVNALNTAKEEGNIFMTS